MTRSKNADTSESPLDPSEFTEEYAQEVREQLAGVPILKAEQVAEIDDYVVDLQYSPDGATLAVASAQGSIHLLNGETLAVLNILSGHDLGELEQEFEPHPNSIAGVAWRGSGERLVSACYGGVRLWEMGTASPKRFFSWKGSPVSLGLSPDGKWIACGCQDNSVHAWKTVSGKDLEMSGYPLKVKEVAWSRDGRYLATAGGAELTVWDFSGKGPSGSRPIVRSGHVELIEQIRFQPFEASSLLASLGKEGALFFWDLRQGRKPLGLGFNVENGKGSRLVWHPNASFAVAGYSSGKIALWRTPASH